jgi:hypothetical protein
VLSRLRDAGVDVPMEARLLALDPSAELVGALTEVARRALLGGLRTVRASERWACRSLAQAAPSVSGHGPT